MADQHVVKRDDGVWAVVGEGNQRSSGSFRTQADAISRAKDIARNQRGEVVIHGRNGEIRDSISYGNDPCPPKDKK